jgi:hypothetical protein
VYGINTHARRRHACREEIGGCTRNARMESRKNYCPRGLLNLSYVVVKLINVKDVPMRQIYFYKKHLSNVLFLTRDQRLPETPFAKLILCTILSYLRLQRKLIFKNITEQYVRFKRKN